MARTGAIEYSEERKNLVYIRTTPCVVCNKQHEFIVDRFGYEAWQYGELIQNALPELSPEDCEVLISGTCDECFNELFPPLTDEDYRQAANDMPEKLEG
jgi:hypothetical protein